jgi:hypothetical protein
MLAGPVTIISPFEKGRLPARRVVVAGEGFDVEKISPHPPKHRGVTSDTARLAGHVVLLTAG